MISKSQMNFAVESFDVLDYEVLESIAFLRKEANSLFCAKTARFAALPYS